MRPGLLRIDEIGRERRNTAPVIDTRIEQVIIARRGKVRRRLDINVRHQQPRYRDRAQRLTTSRFRPIAHGNVRLDAKILHDYFLDMSVAAVQVADREQCVHTILRSLANSNQ